MRPEAKARAFGTTQPVEFADNRRRIRGRIERSDEDHPLRRDHSRGLQRLAPSRHLEAHFLESFANGLGRLAQRHETHRNAPPSRSRHPDGAIDDVHAALDLDEHADEIEPIAVGVEPTGAIPRGANDDIGTGIQQRGDPIWLQIGPRLPIRWRQCESRPQ